MMLSKIFPRMFPVVAAGFGLLASQSAAATSVVGDPLGGLQAMRELNAIVFGNTQGWLAVQGKAFVGGNVVGGGDFGGGNAGRVAQPSDRATLTVGGNIQAYTRLQNGANGSTGRVAGPASLLVGGNVSQLDLATPDAVVKVAGRIANTNGSSGSVVQSGGAGSGYLISNGGTIATRQGAEFASGISGAITADAQTLEADLRVLSRSLAGLQTTTGNSIVDSFGSLSFNAVSDGSGRSVFNLTQAAFSAWRFTLNVAQPSDTIIFNVSGNGNINWNTGLSGAFQSMAGNIIWNFSDADRLGISQAVHGSILAPLAQVGANSALNGSIVAKNLSASSGVNLGTYAGGDLGFSAAVPEPSSWALLILGFGLVGVAVRRRGARAVSEVA